MAASIAGDDRLHAFDFLIDRFQTPEAPAAESGCFHSHADFLFIMLREVYNLWMRSCDAFLRVPG
ncbi:MAG: hypothetical protein OHK0046_47010 [Anaerolineae bacterium]